MIIDYSAFVVRQVNIQKTVEASIHNQIWRKTREESFKNGYEAADERIPLLTKSKNKILKPQTFLQEKLNDASFAVHSKRMRSIAENFDH